MCILERVYKRVTNDCVLKDDSSRVNRGADVGYLSLMTMGRGLTY